MIAGALTLLDGKFDTAHLSTTETAVLPHKPSSFRLAKVNSLNCSAHQSTWHRPKNLEKLFFLFLSLFNCAPTASALDYSARKHVYINCHIYIYSISLSSPRQLATTTPPFSACWISSKREERRRRKKEREKLNPSCAKVILSLLQRAVGERERDRQTDSKDSRETMGVKKG